MYKAIPSLVPVMNPFLSSLYKDQTIQFFLIAVTCICLGMLDGAHASEKPAHTALNLAEINVNDGFADLVEAVKPAVVNISVTGEIKSNISEIAKKTHNSLKSFSRGSSISFPVYTKITIAIETSHTYIKPRRWVPGLLLTPAD